MERHGLVGRKGKELHTAGRGIDIQVDAHGRAARERWREDERKSRWQDGRDGEDHRHQRNEVTRCSPEVMFDEMTQDLPLGCLVPRAWGNMFRSASFWRKMFQHHEDAGVLLARVDASMG